MTITEFEKDATTNNEKTKFYGFRSLVAILFENGMLLNIGTVF